jgi:hypothetical protein
MTFGRTAQKPGNPKPRVKDPKSRTAPLGRDDSWSSRFLAPSFILIFDSATQLCSQSCRVFAERVFAPCVFFSGWHTSDG